VLACSGKVMAHADHTVFGGSGAEEGSVRGNLMGITC
jgi:hypothetical protein